MAEKSEKKSEEKAAAPVPAPAKPAEEKKPAGGGLLKSTPVLLSLAMIIEAAVLLAAFKMLNGGPKSAHADELALSEGSGGHGAASGHGGEQGGGGGKVNPKALVEVSVLEFKAPNKLTGRTFLYDVSICIVIRAENKEKVKAAIESREATIKDRVRTIIAQSDPEKLGGGSEPGLETLRRQVKCQLDEIIGGEGMIEEVLVPRCIPFRADF